MTTRRKSSGGLVARGMLIGLVAASLTAVAPPVTSADPAVDAGAPTLACDDLDSANCLLPFPNDVFTAPDASTDTGRRIALAASSTPKSEITDRQVDPREWNLNDGFSPGTPVLTFVPDIDLHQTWGTTDEAHSDVPANELGYYDYRDHIADIERYLAPDAPIVILDADTGERHPFWSEMDQHGDPGDALLILRPARNFEEGHRYIVALRDMRDANGQVIAPSAGFAAYRDGTADDVRAPHMESLFTGLSDAGIERDDLYLAWDFTVASQRSLTEQVLGIRDDAFAQLGDTDLADVRIQGRSPSFEVTAVETFDEPVEGTARRVSGFVTVPNYLSTTSGGAGSVFNDYGEDGVPDQNGEIEAPFVCNLPEAAVTGGAPARPLLYGHGLLGKHTEVNGASGREMRLRGFATCATPWIGMAADDQQYVATLMADIGDNPAYPGEAGFEAVAERAQQGFLNFMYLGRAMIHPAGFATDEAFRSVNEDGGSRPAIRTARPGDDSPLVYDGNSQGGIMGGAYMALAPDSSRGVLGVTGMNYSTLLNRSVDWERNPYLAGTLYKAYDDPQEQQVVFVLLQMLWDRAEANGYAHHMTTDPLPNTPAHEVLLHVAFGDHQVANVSAEVEARTVEAPIVLPALSPGKHWEKDPFFTPTATYPHRGSALVYWDSGNATPPNGNVPATHDGDPHEDPRREPAGAYQKARFLTHGIVVDVCNRRPYLTDDHPQAGEASYCTRYPKGR